MRKTKKQTRWLALGLCLFLLASVFPLSGMTYAAEQGSNQVHDENCGCKVNGGEAGREGPLGGGCGGGAGRALRLPSRA